MLRPLKYRFPAGDIRKELPSHFKKDGVYIPLKDAKGLVVSNVRLADLGILVLVEATPTDGKIITKSHGEVVDGKWTEIIDEEKTQQEIDIGVKLSRKVFNFREIMNACDAIDTANGNTVLNDKLDSILDNKKFARHLWSAGKLNLGDDLAVQALTIFSESEILSILMEV